MPNMLNLADLASLCYCGKTRLTVRNLKSVQNGLVWHLSTKKEPGIH